MKTGRIRYLLVFFAALLLANHALASARACMAQLAAQERTAILAPDCGGVEHSCPEARIAADCLAHCTPSYKSDEQRPLSDFPASAIAPPSIPNQGEFLPVPGWRVTAPAPPVVGPPLTIRFRNLRI